CDSVKKVDLSQYLIDLDTPLENIAIQSTVTRSQSGLVDDSVDVSYNQADQELFIDVPDEFGDHTLDGILELQAEDDDSNFTTAQTELMIVKISPKIFPIPPAYIFPDTTMEILDLSTIVFDIYDHSPEIDWTIENSDEFDLLEDAAIKDTMLEVTSGSDVGQDTVKIVATNSKGGTDTADVVVVIAPEDPSPIIFDLPNKTVFWKDSTHYIDLDDYVFDAISPDSALDWSVSGYDNSFLEVIINDSTREVGLKTKALTGNTTINFTATDEDGYTSSKDANIMIQKDSSPTWNLSNDVKYIYMSYSEWTRQLDFPLSDKCTDDLTPSRQLKYTSHFSSEMASVEIDSLTTKPTISLDTTGAAQEGWIYFTAEDEQENISSSDTITVVIRETIPPQWTHLPNPINMSNDETYSLNLYNYCDDRDNSDEDLDFSYQLYYDQSQEDKGVDINMDDQGKITISIRNGFYGDAKLQLIAADPDSNKATASTNLNISDRIPPEVTLEYFQNPIAAHRINFVITSDYSSIREFSTSFYKDNQYTNLDFEQIDDSDDHKIWQAEYKFQESAQYKLISHIEDRYYNEAVDTLLIGAEIPKVTGGRIELSDHNISIEYPQFNYSKKQFFMLTRHIKNRTASAQLSKKAEDKTFHFKTSIKNNDITPLVYYTPDQPLNRFYSFYKIVEGRLEPVETYLTTEGEFMAFMESDASFVFKESETPAEKQKVPRNGFLAYPNPFNASVNIKFMVRKKGEVKMQVYNLLGQRVLAERKIFQPGFHSFIWRGSNAKGEKLSSGIYFIVLRRNRKQLKVKKVTFFK
ncbi:MAG TPA: T9SS type A sorting domain-containing protein, partial [bacterium]|nr:T9SS type A sorting domain-containing protein [bacterium]